jgi:hypothetical protein
LNLIAIEMAASNVGWRLKNQRALKRPWTSAVSRKCSLPIKKSRYPTKEKWKGSRFSRNTRGREMKKTLLPL